MTDILLITEQSIKNLTNISDNMSGKLLLPAIREAQEINLREILGDALLDELKRQVAENDVRETYSLLILQCQYYLAYQACANICMITSVKIDNAGLQRVSDEKMEPLPVSEVNQIHDYYQSKADFYCERLQHFLLQHKEDYPQLNTRQCNSINANLYSSATCGIFLGGPRSKGTDRGYGDGLNASKSQGVEKLDVEITENGEYDYTPKGYGYNKVHIDVNTPEIKNQEKSITISENGTTSVIPDEEYTGMDKVSITTDVHPTERLERTYTENGVYEIEGEYNGGEISVKTTPPAEFDFTVLGYSDEESDTVNSYLKKDIEYSTSLIPDYEDNKVYEENNFLFAPLFPTQNRNNFNYMFRNCMSLIYCPSLDTSNGTSFESMFEYDRSLHEIDLIDTSNGIIFIQMFQYCSSLTTIPPLNTSKGIYFNYMFYYDYNLTTIPPLDTSKGIYFDYMFYYNIKLTTISSLDLSEGTSFDNMFYQCESLKDISLMGSINANINFRDSGLLTYDSIKSILTACSNTTNTNSKTVSFNRTIQDQNNELTNLVASCTEKGWTISGLTITA